MNTIHHLLYATSLANAVSRSRRERRWIMIAAIAPDLDGITFWSRELWERVHHTFGHNVFFAAAITAGSLLVARAGRRARLATFAAISVLGLHYLLDLAISGTWPMRPLWPLSSFDVCLGNFVTDQARLDWWLRVPVQWTLVAGAIALSVVTYRRHGRSFIELFSVRLDELFAGYLARMIRGTRCEECGERAGFRCASCHSLLCGTHVRFRRMEAACAGCSDATVVAPS